MGSKSRTQPGKPLCWIGDGQQSWKQSTRIEISSTYVTAQVWLPRLRAQDYKGPHEFVADRAKSLSGAQSERAASWLVFPDGTAQGLTWFCLLVRRDAGRLTALCAASYCNRDYTSRSNDTETPRHIKGNRSRQKRSASLVGSRWEPAHGWRKQLAAEGTRVAAAHSSRALRKKYGS